MLAAGVRSGTSRSLEFISRDRRGGGISSQRLEAVRSREPEVLGGQIQADLRLCDQLIDLRPGDDQRRTEHHGLTHRSHDQIVLEAKLPAFHCSIILLSEKDSLVLGLDQLYGCHETGPSNLAHDWM